MKVIGFFYGLIAYAAFLASFLYAIGFLGNFAVPKTIDTGPVGQLGEALLVNTLLLCCFAVQHSVMARPAFKAWWTKIVPPFIERSTYVLISSLLLGLLFWKWRAISGSVWDIENQLGRFIVYTLFGLGWVIVLLSSFMINHFDLFGLRQVYLRLKNLDYTHLPFQATAFYKLVRHPLMLGFLIAFWSTPDMTLSHLLFSIGTTGYIFVGIFLEERDLTAHLGESFEKYRKEVPMILPIPKRK
jgi:methanethiol S-methyltransferase